MKEGVCRMPSQIGFGFPTEADSRQIFRRKIAKIDDDHAFLSARNRTALGSTENLDSTAIDVVKVFDTIGTKYLDHVQWFLRECRGLCNDDFYGGKENQMIRSTLSRALATTVVSLSISACSAPDLTLTCPIPPGATPAEAAAILSSCFGKMDAIPVNTRAKQDVDILFVIDNSPSMSPKQKQLASAIDSFIQKIDQSGSNYHVGVTSTDIRCAAGAEHRISARQPEHLGL